MKERFEIGDVVKYIGRTDYYNRYSSFNVNREAIVTDEYTNNVGNQLIKLKQEIDKVKDRDMYGQTISENHYVTQFLKASNFKLERAGDISMEKGQPTHIITDGLKTVATAHDAEEAKTKTEELLRKNINGVYHVYELKYKAYTPAVPVQWDEV